MKSGLAIRAGNTESVLESLGRLFGMDVLVGIPEDKTGREDDSPINNAELGYLHPTGATVEIDGTTATLPPRPFLEMGIEDSKPRTTTHLKAAVTAALEGQTEVAMRELGSAGQVAHDAAKVVIGAGDRLHPLSEKALERRRAEGIPSDKLLYAHGYLLRSINYVVKKK